MSGNPMTRGNRRTAFLGLMLALLVALATLAASAPKASASPVSLTFDNGRLTIGGLFDNKVILPATDTFPSDDLPTPQRTDIQLNGDLTDGKITIPASTNTGLQFPYVHLMHPIEQGLKIPITMRLNEPGLTGTWNEKTGAMTLEGKLDVIVITGTGSSFPVPDGLFDVGVPPLNLFARCRVDDVPISLSTAKKNPTVAEPFTGGFGVKGALTTNWDTLPLPESENGGDCEQLNNLLSVPGGLWLANGIVKPKPQEKPDPTCATDQDLCPTPKFTEIDGVRVTPKRRTVKAGKTVVLRVRVHNSGTKAATGVKVRIKSSNPRVKVPKKVVLRVPKKGSGSAKVKVRVKGSAKGRAVIRAATHGWNGRSVLKIKPRR